MKEILTNLLKHCLIYKDEETLNSQLDMFFNHSLKDEIVDESQVHLFPVKKFDNSEVNFFGLYKQEVNGIIKQKAFHFFFFDLKNEIIADLNSSLTSQKTSEIKEEDLNSFLNTIKTLKAKKIVFNSLNFDFCTPDDDDEILSQIADMLLLYVCMPKDISGKMLIVKPEYENLKQAINSFEKKDDNKIMNYFNNNIDVKCHRMNINGFPIRETNCFDDNDLKEALKKRLTEETDNLKKIKEEIVVMYRSNSNKPKNHIISNLIGEEVRGTAIISKICLNFFNLLTDFSNYNSDYNYFFVGINDDDLEIIEKNLEKKEIKKMKEILTKLLKLCLIYKDEETLNSQLDMFFNHSLKDEFIDESQVPLFPVKKFDNSEVNFFKLMKFGKTYSKDNKFFMCSYFDLGINGISIDDKMFCKGFENCDEIIESLNSALISKKASEIKEEDLNLFLTTIEKFKTRSFRSRLKCDFDVPDDDDKILSHIAGMLLSYACVPRDTSRKAFVEKVFVVKPQYKTLGQAEKILMEDDDYDYDYDCDIAIDYSFLEHFAYNKNHKIYRTNINLYNPTENSNNFNDLRELLNKFPTKNQNDINDLKEVLNNLFIEKANDVDDLKELLRKIGQEIIIIYCPNSTKRRNNIISKLIGEEVRGTAIITKKVCNFLNYNFYDGSDIEIPIFLGFKDDEVKIIEDILKNK